MKKYIKIGSKAERLIDMTKGTENENKIIYNRIE